ncbi:MAG: hypothetical protein ABSC94_32215 [Polyangiaceae bacterium]
MNKTFPLCRRPDKTEVAVEQGGFNLRVGVRIEAGDDIGQESLCRYARRPPLSLERLGRCQAAASGTGDTHVRDNPRLQ